MSRQAEREIERLEDELEGCTDPDERRALIGALRDLQRDIDDEQSWREQGAERGWT